LGSESTPKNQETGTTNYWLKNYPKIQQLFSSEMTLNNEKKSDKKYIFENGSIKKLLEVSPQGIPPKYFKLREFLAAKNWKEADYEIYHVMLQVAGREEERWLRVEDLEKFPCEDLRIIDQLWVQYSDGKFGFSVQKKIYKDLGGTREYNREVWEKFGKKVGWYINESWQEVKYEKISDESGLIVVPYQGYLPRFGGVSILVSEGWLLGRGGGCVGLLLFGRAETCRL
ncbi:MAG: GUN4 domain-containing protein, partial [Okeania sp. SIO2D1]|nr:GUN4 domain-containing protein [Okeania sp. SIO2D1]